MKERIDHTNYEAWLLDRLEGNLTPEQEKELDAFLAKHPGLAPDMDDLPTIADDRVYGDKDSLKRSVPPVAAVTDATLEDHLVGRLEGDLTAGQKRDLERFLFEHPEHSRTAALYDRVKIDTGAVAFPEKPMLARAIPPIGAVGRYTLEDHLIAKLEGDLTKEQEQALSLYLQAHPEAQQELRALALTRIGREPIVFDGKAELKKAAKVISIGRQQIFYRIAIAASIAILFALGIWSLQKPAGSEEMIAVVKDADRPPSQASEENATVKIDTGGTIETGIQEPSIEKEVPVTAREKAAVPRSVPQNDPAPALASVPEVNIEEMEPIGPTEVIDVQIAQKDASPAPITVEEPVMQALAEQAPAVPTSEQQVRNMTTLVSTAFREKVLDEPVADDRPLDAADAIAVVDRGLKAVGGSEAGLKVDHSNGKIQRVGLRLGRNFAITASTGR